MSQPEDRVDYPVYFYEHESGEALILDEVATSLPKIKRLFVGQ
jgi:hypothetical protein